MSNIQEFRNSGIQEFRNSGKAIEFFDENGNLQQNLLIKGNNLLALYSLRERLAGKVKLIYIDPPYNTESDSFTYNDSFNHSSWLTFMKNRLEVARDLLKEEGVIFVQCDDNEQAYLKVLMDEIFGRSNFLNQISVKMKQTSGASGGG
ncbi:DNA methyltransferase, partial [Escherichia coli]|uniref:DNA methyltransferase n=2 Tax=Pseudomonadota TaxID=1224 RepID=UPI00203B3EB0